MSEVFSLKQHDEELGITTTVHRVENKVQIVKTYDAEPLLEQAAAERAFTEGQRWGEFRKIGIVPLAVLATFFRQDGGFDRSRAVEWLQQNPKLVTFSRFLK